METVLITGGAGFIGSHISEQLLKMGYRVICFDNFDPYYSQEIKKSNIRPVLHEDNYKLVYGDIRIQETLDYIFEDYDIDYIIHLAAKAGVRNSFLHPFDYNDVNINGTTSLLEKIRDISVKKFVFASSSSIYGSSNKLPYSEEEKCSPISLYGVSKLTGELLCKNYHENFGTKIVCLRYFTVYGPRQRPDMGIYKFVKSAIDKEQIDIFGDGNSERDYTYIDDIVDGTIKAMLSDLDFSILNLGNSSTISLNGLLNLIEELLGSKINRNYVNFKKGDMWKTYADISKSRKMIGFDPGTDLKTGIGNFIKWYKQIYFTL